MTATSRGSARSAGPIQWLRYDDGAAKRHIELVSRSPACLDTAVHDMGQQAIPRAARSAWTQSAMGIGFAPTAWLSLAGRART